jgi:RimJ/RimL family protein N-acetyltransferase
VNLPVLETERLVLRRLTLDDAEFMLGLLNDEAWLRNIGDRGVRTVEAARDYLANGPIAMYEREGFGLYLTELKAGKVAIGICGLIKRAELDDVDLGFAFMPLFRGRGYGLESASAVLAYAQSVLGLARIVAITSPDNDDSIKLLQRIGFRFECMTDLGDPDDPVKLFVALANPGPP